VSFAHKAKSSNLHCRSLSTIALGVACAASMQPLDVSAQSSSDVIEEVVVWGRSLQLLGNADSSSQGVVGYADFSTRPLARVGELVEVVPGMIATQHSGPGKANQYFLRGFNLDHGSDFSTFFDGMPVNFRTHAHAQGYMDLNFIIPELIERIDFKKGPYFANSGDFSLAGTNSMKTYDSLERGFVEVTAGSGDEIRIVAADSLSTEEGSLLYALEHQQTNGMFVLDQDVRKYNGLLKYAGEIAGISSQLTLTAYESEWISTNQVPQRAVTSGQIDRFGFIDPDLGGQSHRYSLSGRFKFGEWDLTAYASAYYMSLINNPTYVLNDPINGDEFEQEDKRVLFGGSLVRESRFDFMGLEAAGLFGAEIRVDDVQELNMFNTRSRLRYGSVREDSARELSLSTFAESEFALSENLRLTTGLRADYIRFDVEALRAQNSGTDSDALLQPKFGLAYRLSDSLELYANYGHGFHSNDVRAAVNRINPVTGENTEAQDILVEGRGGEIGFRYDNLKGFNVTLTAFELATDSELVFVGDAGTTEPSDPTRRSGVELNAFYSINERLVIDLSAARASGHFRGLPDGANSITDAHEVVAAAGLTYVGTQGITASLRVRHFGDAALTVDDSVMKGNSTLINAGVSYAAGAWEMGIDVLNLLDAEDDDIAYFFESRLPGEVEAMEDIHFHPSNPRVIRAILRYSF
jgi:outer membrane receptor protein involved in Fe transport